MIKAIIFDYNRTLFIPEVDSIPKKTIDLLYDLKKHGFLLALISVHEYDREKYLHDHNLYFLFSVVRFVKEKNKAVFKETLQKMNCNHDEAIVVGDRVKSEITIAKNLGIKTIWFRNGKFKDELPDFNETPDWIIGDIAKVKEIVDQL